MVENKVIIKGTSLRVPSSHPHFSSLKFSLTLLDKDGTVNRLYSEDKDTGDLLINRGLLPILFKMRALNIEEIEDLTPTTISSIVDSEDILLKNGLLNNIVLRHEQEIAIMKALRNKRGLIQSATGSGKTYMICGILQYIRNKIGYYPNTIILVPTQYLMESFHETLNSLDIPSRMYNDCRGELDGIIISHPKSLNNDLDKGIINLDNVKILIGDEAHHTQSRTWMRLFLGSINAEYVLGFSASIIDSRRLPINKISYLSFDEANIISSTGDILLDIPTSYYSDGTVLAQPLVARIRHFVSEKILDQKNWHQIRSCQLESQSRSELIANCSAILNNSGLKVLILINTHDHGFKLLEILYNMGFGDVTACSYGGKKYYQMINGDRKELDANSMDRFKSGEIQILIGSSHIYEGVDIPNLDAVIMAVVGKNNRRIIQGVGRSLRRTKNGKYSYIIDFTDKGSGVLSYHSSQRRQMYSNLIGVPEDRMFDDITISEFSNLISNIESNNLKEELEWK